jgi:hypothetical protein
MDLHTRRLKENLKFSNLDLSRELLETFCTTKLESWKFAYMGSLTLESHQKSPGDIFHSGPS